MTSEFFKKVLDNTINSIQETLDVKAMEYIRNNNIMHNFEEGARITGQTREKVLFGFALKHYISIADMRDDLDAGICPTVEQVEEKFGDMINYLILEKASILEKIEIESILEKIEIEMDLKSDGPY